MNGTNYLLFYLHRKPKNDVLKSELLSCVYLVTCVTETYQTNWELPRFGSRLKMAVYEQFMSSIEKMDYLYYCHFNELTIGELKGKRALNPVIMVIILCPVKIILFCSMHRTASVSWHLILIHIFIPKVNNIVYTLSVFFVRF